MIFWTLVAAVLLAALPFGGDRLWAAGLLASSVGVLLLLWGAQLWRGRATLSVPPGRIWPALACFGAVALWIVLQSSSLLPADWEHPLWASAAEALGEDLSGAVGLAPYEANTALMRLFTYAGIFWIALQYAREPRLADVALHGLLATAAIVSVAGVGRWLAGFGPEAGLAGTFDEPGPFGAYAALGAVAALALTMSRLAGARAGSRSAAAGARPVVAAFTGPAAALPAAVLALSVMAIAAGAPLVLLAGLATTALALAVADRPSRWPAFGMLVATMLVVGPFALASRDGDRSVADAIAERTRAAIADAPLYGTGAGSFRDAFQIYRDSRIPAAVERPQASLFATAMELGIPATVVLAGAFAGVAGLSAVGLWRRRRGVVYPVVGLGVTAVVAADAATGTALGVPAVAAAYALVMGVACAQSFGPTAPERPAPAGEPVRIVRAGDRPSATRPAATRVAGQGTGDG